MLYVGKKTPRINNWREAYDRLNLYDGKIEFISDDDEDMIEITYRDGMLIDVGRISANHCYYITVVSSNDEVGWSSPLAEIAVSDKKDLIEKMQGTILKFRLSGS